MTDERSEYYVALFHSTSLAIRSEKICKKAGLTVKLIPTPRHLSSDCGIVLRFSDRDKDAVIRLFDEAKLDCDRICLL